MAEFAAEDIDVKSRNAEDPEHFDIWLQRNLEIIRSLLMHSAWVAPTLLNGWADVAGVGDETAGYSVDGLHHMHLKGYISGGTTADGTVLFNLTAGYRPVSIVRLGGMFVQGSTENSYLLEILQNGNVAIYGVSGSSPILSLHVTVDLDN